MVKISLAIIIAIFLGGCLSSPKGEGPILISKRVENAFERYKGKSNPTHFAVPENGRHYGYSYCGDLKCRKGGRSIALYSCRKRAGSVPCRIFARCEEIVWDGPVSYEYRGIAGGYSSAA